MSDEFLNLHANHRQRVRNRFSREGLESFEPHQVLELLLFFAIPQRDTNALAHELMRKFGSLKNVLDAPKEELLTINGVGENTATLLSLLPELFKKYQEQDDSRIQFLKFEDYKDFLQPRMGYLPTEEIHLICVSANGKLIHYQKAQKGLHNSINVDVQYITHIVLSHNTQFVTVAHNHPDGTPYMSPVDNAFTLKMANALAYQHIRLIDHILVAGEECISSKKIIDEYLKNLNDLNKAERAKLMTNY